MVNGLLVWIVATVRVTVAIVISPFAFAGHAARAIADVVLTGRLLATAKKPAVIAINNVLALLVVPAIATAVNMSNPVGAKPAPGIIPAVNVTAIVSVGPAVNVAVSAAVGRAKRATGKAAVTVTIASAGPAAPVNAPAETGPLPNLGLAAVKKVIVLVIRAAIGTQALSCKIRILNLKQLSSVNSALIYQDYF